MDCFPPKLWSINHKNAMFVFTRGLGSLLVNHKNSFKNHSFERYFNTLKSVWNSWISHLKGLNLDLKTPHSSLEKLNGSFPISSRVQLPLCLFLQGSEALKLSFKKRTPRPPFWITFYFPGPRSHSRLCPRVKSQGPTTFHRSPKLYECQNVPLSNVSVSVM